MQSGEEGEGGRDVDERPKGIIRAWSLSTLESALINVLAM